LPGIEFLAWFGGFMLVFWAPFWSGARLPLLLLLLIGIVRHRKLGASLLRQMPERRWGILFLFLFIPSLLSSFYSYDPKGSFTVSAVLLLHYWVGLALLAGMRNDGHARMAWGIGFILVFWSFDGVIQLLFGKDLFGVSLTPPDMRITGPFGDNLRMGLFISVMMPLLLWPLAHRKPFLALALFACMSTISFLAGARTNLVFTTLVALLLLARFPTWKQRFALLVLSLAPLLAIPLSPALQERVTQRDYVDVLKSARDSGGPDTFDRVNKLLSGRLSIWDTAGNMLNAHPIVGVGPGAFDHAYSQHSRRTDDPFRTANDQGKHAYHAHQMYVGAAAETGLVGLAGLLAVIGFVGHWFRRASLLARARAAPYLACLAVIAFPLNSQPVLLLGWWFPVVLLLLCGFLAALEEHPHSHLPRQE
jgi:O-antigen ligase